MPDYERFGGRCLLYRPYRKQSITRCHKATQKPPNICLNTEISGLIDSPYDALKMTGRMMRLAKTGTEGFASPAHHTI